MLGSPECKQEHETPKHFVRKMLNLSKNALLLGTEKYGCQKF